MLQAHNEYTDACTVVPDIQNLHNEYKGACTLPLTYTSCVTLHDLLVLALSLGQVCEAYADG